MKPLLKNDYLLAPSYDWTWQQTSPTVMRKQTAMTLTGQSAESIIAPQWSNKIGFSLF